MRFAISWLRPLPLAFQTVVVALVLAAAAVAFFHLTQLCFGRVRGGAAVVRRESTWSWRSAASTQTYLAAGVPPMWVALVWLGFVWFLWSWRVGRPDSI